MIILRQAMVKENMQTAPCIKVIGNMTSMTAMESYIHFKEMCMKDNLKTICMMVMENLYTQISRYILAIGAKI